MGFVARRVRGTASAVARRERSRSRASSRLRACERSSCATAVRRGPTRAITRRFCSSVRAEEPATSNDASMREAVTLACWPPGPEERLARSSTSDSGTATPRDTGMGSSITVATSKRQQAYRRVSVVRAWHDVGMRVGLVLGAGGVMGGAWLTGGLHALATETGWDPATADRVVGTSAGAMMGALLASGVPPWFMVAHSAGETFDGLQDAGGRPQHEASRSAGAEFRIDRRARLPIGPGSWRLALSSLSNPTRHTPATLFGGWLPRGVISTEPLKDTIRRVVPEGWVDHAGTWILACDYSNGRRVAFGREDAPPADLVDAVAASCAIPGFFTPVKIGGARVRRRRHALHVESRRAPRRGPRPGDLPEPHLVAASAARLEPGRTRGGGVPARVRAPARERGPRACARPARASC